MLYLVQLDFLVFVTGERFVYMMFGTAATSAAAGTSSYRWFAGASDQARLEFETGF